MKKSNFKQKFMNRISRNILITLLSIVLIYVMISIYFINHYFFNTVINGMDFSLKAHRETDTIVRNYINDYKLLLIERNGETEELTGQAIKMQYNKENSIPEILQQNNSLKWMFSLFRDQKYYTNALFIYDANKLKSEMLDLNCLNTIEIEPQNVSFLYSNGSYKVMKEVQGNKILKDKLFEVIKMSVLYGDQYLNLDEKLCYAHPKYTANSFKAAETLKVLNKYVSANLNYKLDTKNERLDGDKIHKWLDVDENLDVVIDKTEIIEYVNELRKNFDTVGVKRKFNTSTGKTIEVEGGLYGWKIDLAAETEALLKNVYLGETIEREPIYAQRALFMGADEIGDTYVEVNISKQYLWYYKNSKLIIQGPIVTGNPNKGNSTVTGTYMLNYKQKGATLRGANYATEVTYWMPFFGNIGIHDASWRYSFGGEIYKNNGTHGCINTPLYLAKTIFDNIDEGIPIIIYEE